MFSRTTVLSWAGSWTCRRHQGWLLSSTRYQKWKKSTCVWRLLVVQRVPRPHWESRVSAKTMLSHLSERQKVRGENRHRFGEGWKKWAFWPFPGKQELIVFWKAIWSYLPKYNRCSPLDSEFCFQKKKNLTEIHRQMSKKIIWKHDCYNIALNWKSSEKLF